MPQLATPFTSVNSTALRHGLTNAGKQNEAVGTCVAEASATSPAGQRCQLTACSLEYAQTVAADPCQHPHPLLTPVLPCGQGATCGLRPQRAAVAGRPTSKQDLTPPRLTKATGQAENDLHPGYLPRAWGRHRPSRARKLGVQIRVGIPSDGLNNVVNSAAVSAMPASLRPFSRAKS